MSDERLAYSVFSIGGRDEHLMRIGPEGGSPVLVVPPLFEEMNRLRSLLASFMRRLAARGFGCWLPDLRGTNESLSDIAQVEWDDWRHDVIAASNHVRDHSGQMPIVAAIRGGALIDDQAAAIGFWRLSPVPGRSLARDLARAGLSGVAWAGYSPSDALRARLEAAEPAEIGNLRVARLSSDPGAADVKLPGPALWRRSEPGASDQLAEAMAADLAEWSARCAAS